MDNIQMGQMGIGTDLPLNFTGCNCTYCKKQFLTRYSVDIPTDFHNDKSLSQKYLEFRVDTTPTFLKDISEHVYNHKLQFGSNSFDPKKVDLKILTGVDINEISKFQDYILFENNSFPTEDRKINNRYIDLIGKKLKKPVFVVSYRKGIGHEGAFTQKDFETLLSEQKAYHFHACIKGCEYTTKKLWHNLDPYRYQKLSLNSHYHEPLVKIHKIGNSTIIPLLERYYNPLMTKYFEYKTVRKVVDPILNYSLR